MNLKTRKYDNSKRQAEAEARRTHILKCAARLISAASEDAFRLEDVGLTVATLESVGPDGVNFTAFANLEIDDLEAFVRTVFSAYDKIGDLVIRALAEEHRSPVFQGALDVGRTYHVEWISVVFAPYLARRSPAERDLLFTAFWVMMIVAIPAIILTLFFVWRYRSGAKKAAYAPEWDR